MLTAVISYQMDQDFSWLARLDLWFSASFQARTKCPVFFKRRSMKKAMKLIGSGILRILKEFMAWDIDSWNVYHSVVYSNDRRVFSDVSLKVLVLKASTEKKVLPNSDIWSKSKFTTNVNGTQSSTLGNENTENDQQAEVMIDNAILSTALRRNALRRIAKSD